MSVSRLAQWHHLPVNPPRGDSNPNTTPEIDRDLGGRGLRVLSLALLAVVVVVSGAVYSSLAAILVASLGLLTLVAPGAGAAALFLVSTPQLLDLPHPFVGGSTIHFWEIALGATVAGLLGRRGTRLDLRPLLWGAPLILALVASGIANLDAYKVAPHVLRGSAPVLSLLVGWNAAGGAARGRWMRGAVAAAVAICGGAALVQFAIAPGRVNWPFYIATTLGAYVALLLPFGLLWLLTSRSRRLQTWLWSAVVLVLGLLLLLSLTRAAVLAALVAAVVAWAGGRHRISTSPATARVVRVFVAVSMLLGAVAAVLVATRPAPDPAGQPDTLTRLDPRVALRHFIDLRLPMLRLGVEMWSDHPLFGVGPGQYPRRVRDYEDRLAEYSPRLPRYPLEVERAPYHSHVHMAYLQIAIELGLFGLLGYLWLLFALGAHLWDGRSQVWCLAGLAAFAGLLAFNLVGYSLSALAPEWGLLLGTSARIGSRPKPG